MRNTKFQGQVGLLLLVVMGVVVALVMSVASRSLSDTVLSRQERESSAAFTVAETGVEKALNSLSQNVVPNGTLSFTDSTGAITGTYGVVASTSYALYVPEGEVAQLDLTGFSGPLTVAWTKKADVSENPATCNEGSGGAPAALQFMVIRGAATPLNISMNYLNPYNCSPSNGFGASSAGSGIYRSSLTWTPISTATALRLTPIYSGATISVTGAGLKTQLYLVQSSSVGGDAKKAIQVTRGLSAPSSVFDFALFSGNTIVK